MAKELMLTAPVDGLGIEGDVVKVAEGYARNFLLPRKLAEPVTESVRRRLAKARAARLDELEKGKAKAQKVAEKLEGISLTIPVKTHDDGKMFGSITAVEISKALAAEGLDISKNQIRLDHPVKELGVIETKADLHPDVTQPFKVWVVEE